MKGWWNKIIFYAMTDSPRLSNTAYFQSTEWTMKASLIPLLLATIVYQKMTNHFNSFFHVHYFHIKVSSFYCFPKLSPLICLFRFPLSSYIPFSFPLPLPLYLLLHRNHCILHTYVITPYFPTRMCQYLIQLIPHPLCPLPQNPQHSNLSLCT